MSRVLFYEGEKGTNNLGRVEFLYGDGRKVELSFDFEEPSVRMFSDVYEEVLCEQCCFPVKMDVLYEGNGGFSKGIMERVYFLVDSSLKEAFFFSEKGKNTLVRMLFKDDIVRVPYEMGERILGRQAELTKEAVLDVMRDEVSKSLSGIERFFLYREVGGSSNEEDGIYAFLDVIERADREYEERRFVLLPSSKEGSFFTNLGWSLFRKGLSSYYIKLGDLLHCYLSHPEVKHLHLIVNMGYTLNPGFFYEKMVKSEGEKDEVYLLTKEDIKMLVEQFRDDLIKEKERLEGAYRGEVVLQRVFDAMGRNVPNKVSIVKTI